MPSDALSLNVGVLCSACVITVQSCLSHMVTLMTQQLSQPPRKEPKSVNFSLTDIVSRILEH